MGILRGISRYRERQKNKDFFERRKKFQVEYEALVKKYGCDWGATIIVVAEGKQALSKLSLYDISEQLKQEEAGEKEQNQVLKNMSIVPDDVSVKARVEIFVRIEGRVPNKEGDNLTAEMCEKFIEKFKGDPKLSYLIPFCKKEIVRILAENKRLIIEGKGNEEGK